MWAVYILSKGLLLPMHLEVVGLLCTTRQSCLPSIPISRWWSMATISFPWNCLHFLFFGFWFFHPEPLSQNIRKALSFLDACEKSNLLDTDHTITSPSILGSDQLFVWWFFTLSQVSIVIFIVKHLVWKRYKINNIIRFCILFCCLIILLLLNIMY